MTEAEWLACTDPDVMLEFLRDRASDRKFRLFVCACCRRLLPLLTGKLKPAGRVCEKALAVSERFADGLADQDELDVLSAGDLYRFTSGPGFLAVQTAYRATYVKIAGDERPMRFGRRLIGHAASEGAEFARVVASRIAGRGSGKSSTARKRAATIQEKSMQVQLLHDLFGNPCRRSRSRSAKRGRTATLSRWGAVQGGLVWKLANSIYAERAFDRLPILADALEEAGCTDAEILGHCRGPGPHLRGCWVVDLLLGKE
jgi:hypothetical protein